MTFQEYLNRNKKKTFSSFQDFLNTEKESSFLEETPVLPSRDLSAIFKPEPKQVESIKPPDLTGAITSRFKAMTEAGESIPGMAKKLGATAASGVMEGAASLYNVFDLLSWSMAKDLSKVTKIPEEKLRGGLFKQLKDQSQYWADRLDKEGFSEGIGTDIVKGLTGSIPDLAILSTMGPGGLPIWGAFKGMTGGPVGTVTGAIQGATFEKLFRIAHAVPSKLKYPTLAGGFAALEPGDVKAKATAAGIGMGLGLSGKGQKKTFKEFLAEHKRVAEPIKEQAGLVRPDLPEFKTLGEAFMKSPSSVLNPLRNVVWNSEKKTMVELDQNITDYKPTEHEILFEKDVTTGKAVIIDRGEKAKVTPDLLNKVGEIRTRTKEVEPVKPIELPLTETRAVPKPWELPRAEFEGSKSLVPAYIEDDGTVKIGTSHKVIKPEGRAYDPNKTGFAFVQDKELLSNIETAKDAGKSGDKAFFISLKDLEAAQGDYYKAFQDRWGQKIKPITIEVYHGTGRKVGEFDKDLIGSATDGGHYGTGFYFSSSPETAGFYAKRRGGTPNIIKAKIQFNKPFVINWTTLETAKITKDLAKQVGIEFSGSGMIISPDAATKRLQSSGYDGVIIKRPNEPVEYVVFEQNNISIVPEKHMEISKTEISEPIIEPQVQLIPEARPLPPREELPLTKAQIKRATVPEAKSSQAKPTDYPDLKRLGMDQPVKTLGDPHGKGNKPGADSLSKREFTEMLQLPLLPKRAVKYAYENPIRVFEEYPFLKKQLYDPLVDGRKWEGDQRKILNTSIKDISKGLNKQNKYRVLVYAQGMQEGGKITLRKMGVKQLLSWEELNPREQNAYTVMRQQLDSFLGSVNKMREKLGLDPIPEVKNYFPFIRDPAYVDEFIHALIFEPATDILWGTLTEPAFEYARKRDPYAKLPFERDAIAVFREYAQKAIKYQAVAPVIAKANLLLNPITVTIGQDVMQFSLKEKDINLHRYLDSWYKFATQKIQPETGTPIVIKRWAKALNRNIGVAVLAGNIRSALIQFTQLRNTYTALGEKYFLEGLKGGLNLAKSKWAYKTARTLQNRILDLHVQTTQELPPRPRQTAAGARPTLKERASYYGKKGLYVYGRSTRAAGKIGFYPLQVLDLWAAEISWIGAHAKATKALGLTGKEAIIYADDFVTKYQASAALHDLAPIQRTVVGQLMTLFQTFTINEWNMLSKDILGYKVKGMTWQQRGLNLTRVLLSTALINYLFEKKLKLRSPFPCPEYVIYQAIKDKESPINIARLAVREMTEQIPIVGGGLRYSTVYKKFTPAGIQIYSDFLQIVLKALGTVNFGAFKEEDYATLGRLFGVAGTGQMEKFFRRIHKGATPFDAMLGVKSELAGGRTIDQKQYLKDLNYILDKYGKD